MQNDQFSIHGDLALWVADNILMLEGTGPWNVESVQASGKKAVELKAQLHGKRWGVLMVVHGDPIYVPEAADMITESVVEDIKKGRTASAVVVSESNSPDFGKRHISKIYQQAGECFEFFDDVETAKVWLQQQLEQAERKNSTG